MVVPAAATAPATALAYAIRRLVSAELTARRSLAAVMLANVAASIPGAGSKYWVRRSWSPRSMRRYRANSA